MIKLTLGDDSEARKRVQLVAAFLRYIPAAAARFALHSKAGNDKHNPGEPVHHARGKSSDHEECVLRHLVDMQDIGAYIERNGPTAEAIKMLLDEVTAEFWRTGILLQELCEKYEGAPLAPAARLPERAELNPGAAEYGLRLHGGTELRDAAEAGESVKLPQLRAGSPRGSPWRVLDGDGNLISLHDYYIDAEDAFRRLLNFPGPINTPAEAAELAKAQGTVRLVATPLVPTFTYDKRGRHMESFGPPIDDIDYPEDALDYPEKGTAEHGFELFKDCPSERGNGPGRCEFSVDKGAYMCERDKGHDGPCGSNAAERAAEAGLERCGVMDKPSGNVCALDAGHAGAHASPFRVFG